MVKRLVDPNAPKRPLSGYFLWVGDNRAALQKQNPEASIVEMSKILGETWKSLGAAGKKEISGFVQEEVRSLCQGHGKIQENSLVCRPCEVGKGGQDEVCKEAISQGRKCSQTSSVWLPYLDYGGRKTQVRKKQPGRDGNRNHKSSGGAVARFVRRREAEIQRQVGEEENFLPEGGREVPQDCVVQEVRRGEGGLQSRAIQEAGPARRGDDFTIQEGQEVEVPEEDLQIEVQATLPFTI